MRKFKMNGDATIAFSDEVEAETPEKAMQISKAYAERAASKGFGSQLEAINIDIYHLEEVGADES